MQNSFFVPNETGYCAFKDHLSDFNASLFSQCRKSTFNQFLTDLKHFLGNFKKFDDWTADMTIVRTVQKSIFNSSVNVTWGIFN